MMRRSLAVACALVLAGAVTVSAADIVIVNMDGAAEGFNDPTPVSPVGGNTGTTLGQQRLVVFQAAADIWGALLPSDVTIYVEAQFDPLFCNSSDAFLGFAGTLEAFRDFPGAPEPGTWYHVALANKLAGIDLSVDNDIGITFNSDMDFNNNCLQGVNWYYGLDGNEGTDVELLPVVLHELAHGLGFTTFVDRTTGAEFMGYPDIYETFVLDNTTGLHWDEMTNAQRQASAVNSGNVVWDGPAVTAEADSFLSPVPILVGNSPLSLPDTMLVSEADFGPRFTQTGVTGDVVLVDDGTGTVTDACEPIINGGEVAGNIALIDRAGDCIWDFTGKARRAQDAGAIAVLIANYQSGSIPPYLSGTDTSIVIPVAGLTRADGDSIKAHLSEGVNVTVMAHPSALVGADGNHRVQLHAPASGVGPNSISHWSRAPFPDLLMEPSLNDGLSSDVDLTLAHFEDLGWLGTATGIPPDRRLPSALALLPVYPNPFNPRTSIRYTLPQAQVIHLGVYDTRGRTVRTLVEGFQPAGPASVTWDGRNDRGQNVASGIYFLRLAGSQQSTTRKVVLLK